MSNDSASQIYSYDFTIPESAIDENGHVNNVAIPEEVISVFPAHNKKSSS